MDSNHTSDATEPTGECEHFIDGTPGLRHALQKNFIVRSMHERLQRHLALQHQRKGHMISRDQKEVLDQLQRLQVEQSVVSHLDSDEGGEEDRGDNDLLFPVEVDNDDEEAPFVNPYPVTMVTRKKSAPGSVTRPSRAKEGGYGAGNRRQSVEFEDLRLVTSTGKILPPGSARKRSARKPPLTLRRADSLSTVRVDSPSEKQEAWVGEPEAISSVRRPKKSLAQQRIDFLTNRSNSFKENSRNVVAAARSGLTRSQSLKDRGIGWKSRPSSGAMSRSNSWKGSRQNTSCVSLSDSVASLDINPDFKQTVAVGYKQGKAVRKISPVPRQPSRPSLYEASSSPETKSSVWGYLAGSEQDIRVDDPGLLHRRRMRARGLNPDLLPPLARPQSGQELSPRNLSPSHQGRPGSSSPLAASAPSTAKGSPTRSVHAHRKSPTTSGVYSFDLPF